ncbi:MAG: thioredoxin domain-containing protein [Rhodanobacteraceae bacterium]
MSNHLANETSPYLRQHADNPVDWWPWCDEALSTARREHKPILLSIGYAACHWCHVMAHESFEDADVARVMNALYINIKVDREERPDIDKVYQLAYQAFARRGGGWPLTMFLAPDDLVPFYAGTYFPKTPRSGLPAFVEVLEGARRWFDQNPDEVRVQGAALTALLVDHGRMAPSAAALTDAPVVSALKQISAGFDHEYGGHRGAPKFPHAPELELMLDRAGASATTVAGEALYEVMARLTLGHMADGGLQDQLGGGFFRYSVDARWEIPHFEKMLYDNALLLPLYARVAMQLYEERFANTAQACVEWIKREMTAPGGGFYSSLDADSDGEEGRYYIWTVDDIRRLLPAEEFAVAERHWGLDRPPNFDGRTWHLRVTEPLADTATKLGIEEYVARERLLAARGSLFAKRAGRTRPGLDDKILTAWNALMIAGAARAARWLSEAPLSGESECALTFLHENLWRDGRLYACHAGGQAKFPAYLDDYAFLLDALVLMLQRRWKRRDLDWAIALADALIERFEDRENGGFYFTGHDAEPLPQRPKSFVDEALPNGNGVAARALLKLGRLLGETRYLDAVERTLRAAWPMLNESPRACCSVLLALDEFLNPRAHLVIRCASGGEAVRWQHALGVILSSTVALDAYLLASENAPLPGVLATQTPGAGGSAYLCRGMACSPRIATPQALQELVAKMFPGSQP